MEDVLKKLLDAEIQAEALVEDAEAKHAQMVQQARDDALAAEALLEKKIPDLRESFVRQANDRAQQSIAELKRRYDERQKDFHQIAESHTAEAAAAALALLLDAEKG